MPWRGTALNSSLSQLRHPKFRLRLHDEKGAIIMAPTAMTAPVPTSITSTKRSSCDPGLDQEVDIISPLQAALVSETTPLAVRFRALFSLKHYASLHPPEATTIPAIEAIAAALSSPSALLKHELAYCLGQSANQASAPYLQCVLKDENEDSMCRHEAAEALGALEDENSLELLRSHWHDDNEKQVVRETCEIAVGRIQWAHSESRRCERLQDR